MKNKQGFFDAIHSDLRRGIMRVVYASDELAVCAVADSFYFASDYTVNQDGFVAFLVNSKMVRAMLVDNTFLERLLTTSSPEELKQMMFRLTGKTFHTFQNGWRGKSYVELTNKLVDPELEAWITETFGTPEEAKLADKKQGGLFGRFRK